MPTHLTRRCSILHLSRAERWWPGSMVAQSHPPRRCCWARPIVQSERFVGLFTDQRMADLVEQG
jgi:hypothetical protein